MEMIAEETGADLFEVLPEEDYYPFSTHEGSGLSGFDSKLAEAIPDAEVLDGFAARGDDAQNNQESVRTSVGEWIAGLGLQ